MQLLMQVTTWRVGEMAHHKIFPAKIYSMVGKFHIPVGEEYNALEKVLGLVVVS